MSEHTDAAQRIEALEAELEAASAEAPPPEPRDFSTLKLPFAPGEWRDADERMFQACFAILGQYVEDELGKSDDPTDHRGYRLHSADVAPGEGMGGPEGPSPDRRAIDLWLWYRDELSVVEAEYDADVAECYSGEMKTVPVPGGHRVVDFGKVREPRYPHDWPETVKDAKLRELIELRRALWT